MQTTESSKSSSRARTATGSLTHTQTQRLEHTFVYENQTKKFQFIY
jgi:hypothetical protein